MSVLVLKLLKSTYIFENKYFFNFKHKPAFTLQHSATLFVSGTLIAFCYFPFFTDYIYDGNICSFVSYSYHTSLVMNIILKAFFEPVK